MTGETCVDRASRKCAPGFRLMPPCRVNFKHGQFVVFLRGGRTPTSPAHHSRPACHPAARHRERRIRAEKPVSTSLRAVADGWLAICRLGCMGDSKRKSSRQRKQKQALAASSTHYQARLEWGLARGLDVLTSLGYLSARQAYLAHARLVCFGVYGCFRSIDNGRANYQ